VSEEPERAQQMADKCIEWVNENNVYPKPAKK